MCVHGRENQFGDLLKRHHTSGGYVYVHIHIRIHTYDKSLQLFSSIHLVLTMETTLPFIKLSLGGLCPPPLSQLTSPFHRQALTPSLRLPHVSLASTYDAASLTSIMALAPPPLFRPLSPLNCPSASVLPVFNVTGRSSPYSRGSLWPQTQYGGHEPHTTIKHS